MTWPCLLRQPLPGIALSEKKVQESSCYRKKQSTALKPRIVSLPARNGCLTLTQAETLRDVCGTKRVGFWWPLVRANTHFMSTTFQRFQLLPNGEQQTVLMVLTRDTGWRARQPWFKPQFYWNKDLEAILLKALTFCLGLQLFNLTPLSPFCICLLHSESSSAVILDSRNRSDG
jgi:hypothetical protein